MATLETKERISSGASFLMKTTAGLIDATGGLINLIPVAGQVISVIIDILGYMLFGLWFLCKGISPFSSKNAPRFFGTALIEIIPILNMLPGLSLFVFRTINIVQKEDQEYNEKNKDALNQQTAQRKAQAQMAWEQKMSQNQEEDEY